MIIKEPPKKSKIKILNFLPILVFVLLIVFLIFRFPILTFVSNKVSGNSADQKILDVDLWEEIIDTNEYFNLHIYYAPEEHLAEDIILLTLKDSIDIYGENSPISADTSLNVYGYINGKTIAYLINEKDIKPKISYNSLDSSDFGYIFSVGWLIPIAFNEKTESIHISITWDNNGIEYEEVIDYSVSK